MDRGGSTSIQCCGFWRVETRSGLLDFHTCEHASVACQIGTGSGICQSQQNYLERPQVQPAVLDPLSPDRPDTFRRYHPDGCGESRERNSLGERTPATTCAGLLDLSAFLVVGISPGGTAAGVATEP